tara:strand:- start:3069 stop:3665 length:597 start_codon:yes stop_codon:yes gene_type:complete
LQTAQRQSLAEAIDRLLPQTQCTRCGYLACKPYAEAIADGAAEINRCPPGGAAGIARIAQLLDRAELPLDTDCGEEKKVETVARVIEADCIGCTKCIQACPVDAIVGAMNLMHTVISDECNGCELCIPPCPVDCIVMDAAPEHPPAFELAQQFRARFEARTQRIHRLEEQRRLKRQARKAANDPVAAALARAKARTPP